MLDAPPTLAGHNPRTPVARASAVHRTWSGRIRAHRASLDGALVSRSGPTRRKVRAISRPTLTVAGITWNSGDRLEHWVTRALEYADEIVLLVDASSTDDTYEIARTYADSLKLVEHPPFIEVFYDLALRQARGDWILWLDDDEFMGRDFVRTRDALLRERHLTHYHLPYRWVVRGKDGNDHWLATFPWHPNPRLRLVRNVGSIYHHRGRLHSPLEIAGDGRIVNPDEAVMYHLDSHGETGRSEKRRWPVTARRTRRRARSTTSTKSTNARCKPSQCPSRWSASPAPRLSPRQLTDEPGRPLPRRNSDPSR